MFSLLHHVERWIMKPGTVQISYKLWLSRISQAACLVSNFRFQFQVSSFKSSVFGC